MNKELFDRMAKFDEMLNSAYNLGFIRALTRSQYDELAEIGKELGITISNIHCPACQLEFVKKLGKPYFEYKNKPKPKPKKGKESKNETKEKPTESIPIE